MPCRAIRLIPTCSRLVPVGAGGTLMTRRTGRHGMLGIGSALIGEINRQTVESVVVGGDSCSCAATSLRG